MVLQLHPAKLSIPTLTLLLIASFLADGEVQAQKNQQPIPDFTKGDPIPEGAVHDWNLGPTGARGWIYSNRLETTEARQILITKVDNGSPSSGKLKPGDIILGIAGQPFQFDPRVELGKKIVAAEGSNGKLELMRWRKGKTETAIIPLQVIGSYSRYAPFQCAKSKLIFDEGCRQLAKQMRENPDAGNPITRSLNALALLSSGRQEYLPLVKEQVAWAANFSDPDSRMLHSWYYGPVNILLAEYTLATDDKTFLPDLERITMEIVRGQSNIGSWGHRFALPNGRLKGYGMMNAPGLPLTLSLVLARTAGVNHPELDEAIEKSARLIRFYVGKGSVPYGDHHPWIETHDDNGKNGVAALLFNLLNDADAAEYFSRMSVASHGGEREMGHTGNFFNMLWAMPAVALSGANASGQWMDEFGWYFDLARKWDFQWQHQGPPQTKNDSYRAWDSSGAYLLSYAQPLRRLYITGKQQGVVSPVERPVAMGLIEDGRGYSHRLKQRAYDKRSLPQIYAGLGSWSPVVRERSASSLAEREGDHIPKLIEMLESKDLNSQLGACQAISKLRKKAATAVPTLQKTLGHDDLWLRIKAADALASIGPDARVAIPQMLAMLASEKPQADPRGMQQRYLCFALFDRRNGLIKGSLKGIDRAALNSAIRAGLANEDGRARGALATVFKNLSRQEMEPLLTDVHQAVLTPAPSGNMFADGVRLSGLDVLAEHKVFEGMSLCVDLIELERWGQGKRIIRCLQALQKYRGAAKDFVPRLIDLKTALQKRKQNKNTRKQLEVLQETVDLIQADNNPPILRSLPKPE